jgi:hypothetical protein
MESMGNINHCHHTHWVDDTTMKEPDYPKTRAELMALPILEPKEETIDQIVTYYWPAKIIAHQIRQDQIIYSVDSNGIVWKPVLCPSGEWFRDEL